MERRRRSLLTALPAVAGALAGCLESPSGRNSDPDAAGTDTGSRTDRATTATDAPSTPDYATCDPAAVVTSPDASYPSPPAEQTTERVAEYVETLETAILLPPEDEMTDGWVDIGSVSVDAVDHGFLAYVPVNGGYYNEEMDGSTATQHADLGRHTASYFLNERVVRRASEQERADAREADALLCNAE